MPASAPLPPWPDEPPSSGGVVLRPLRQDDVAMARDLATDPYVPLIGTLPAHASEEQARDWIERNQRRWSEGRGFSFAIADARTERAVGQAGLWLAAWPAGPAEAGYGIAPGARGHGHAADALRALTAFAWTLPGLDRVQLHIEPWNTASVRTAERAGYRREGLLRGHSEIGGRRRDVLRYATVRPG